MSRIIVIDSCRQGSRVVNELNVMLLILIDTIIIMMSKVFEFVSGCKS